MRIYILGLLVAFTISAKAAEDRVQKVLQDAATVNGAGYWIYNDLAKGFATAKGNGKPLLVVLRCVP